MSSAGSSAGHGRRALCAAPLVLAALVVLGVTLACAVNGLRRLAPNDPWEAGHVVDAWRWAEGEPIYEPPGTGHATGMYGPLLPVLAGWSFRWTGANNLAPRVLSLASGLALAALVALVVLRGAPPEIRLVGFALVLALDGRVAHFLTVGRPDYAATLLGCLAVVLFAAGARGRPLLYGLGLVVLVVAVLFKQTAAMAAAIPAVVLLPERSRTLASRLVLAALPLLAVGALVLAIRAGAPALHHWMFELPARYRVSAPSALGHGWFVLVSAPLALVALGDRLVHGGVASLAREARWLLGAALVCVPASAWCSAKVGGWENSLLPAHVALAGFGAWWLGAVGYPALLEASTARSLVLAALLGLLVLSSALPVPAPLYATTRASEAGTERSSLPVLVQSPSRAFGLDRDYPLVLEMVRGLEGTLVCPQDPTIPLHARGVAGLQLQMEADALPIHGYYTTQLPDSVRAEIAGAQHVLLVRRDLPHDALLGADALAVLGFRVTWTAPGGGYARMSRSRAEEAPGR